MKANRGVRAVSSVTTWGICCAITCFAAGERAIAGDCPCSTDIAGGNPCEPSGGTSLLDGFAMVACIFGTSTCDPEFLNCDINCDGVFNLVDASIFYCNFFTTADPAVCCVDPGLGACCLPGGECELASEYVCSLVLEAEGIALSPTNFSPNSTCQLFLCAVGGMPIPAVSEWGVLILVLGLLSAGTLVLRRRVHDTL